MLTMVEMQRIWEPERELQRVFDRWPFQPGSVQSVQTDSWDYTVVGRPSWLDARRRSNIAPTMRASRGYDFRPDLAWDAGDRLFVIELKSAAKYEPLALAEVLHHAREIEKRLTHPDAGDGPYRSVVPVMVTQYSGWLRASLEYLFEHGLEHGALRFLEFEMLAVPTRAGGARLLWLDDPFSTWTRELAPPKFALGLSSDAFNHRSRFWYRNEVADTWVTTEQPQDEAGHFTAIEGPHSMMAPTEGQSFVLWSWSGATDVRGAYHLCSSGPDAGARLASPRLARPEQVEDFSMEIGDEASLRG